MKERNSKELSIKFQIRDKIVTNKKYLQEFDFPSMDIPS